MSRSAPEPDSPEPNAVGALKPPAPHASTASSALEEAGSRTAVPRIPDHELLRPIGRGAYGEVWLARNKLGTLRAVKIVYRKTFEDARPFEREFKGIQKFEPISRSHEGLVDILQVGGTDEYFYYVMELADDAAQNPKPEIRNPKEARNPNAETNAEGQPIRTSGFGFPSDFGFQPFNGLAFHRLPRPSSSSRSATRGRMESRTTGAGRTRLRLLRTRAEP